MWFRGNFRKGHVFVVAETVFKHTYFMDFLYLQNCGILKVVRDTRRTEQYILE